MARVAIINTKGDILATGEWDGKVVDGEYAKVDNRFFHLAYVYEESDADTVSTLFKTNAAMLKNANDNHDAEMYRIRNNYLRPKS